MVTVGELIEMLQVCDPNDPVIISNTDLSDEPNHELRYVEIIAVNEMAKENKGRVIILAEAPLHIQG